jgi:serine/threonine protein kinase
MTPGYDAAKADVWSFGVTLWVCVAGSSPWSVAGPSSRRFRAYVRATQAHVLSDVMLAPGCAEWEYGEGGGGGGEGGGEDEDEVGAAAGWHWPRAFSGGLVDLLTGCLRVRAGERLSMSGVVDHPWFRDSNWEPPRASRTAATECSAAAAAKSSASDLKGICKSIGCLSVQAHHDDSDV